jgi:hypothetical protein
MLRIARFDQIVNEAAKYRPSPEFRVQWSTERLLVTVLPIHGTKNGTFLPVNFLKNYVNYVLLRENHLAFFAIGRCFMMFLRYF